MKLSSMNNAASFISQEIHKGLIVDSVDQVKTMLKQNLGLSFNNTLIRKILR